MRTEADSEETEGPTSTEADLRRDTEPSKRQIAYDHRKALKEVLLTIPKGEKMTVREIEAKAGFVLLAADLRELKVMLSGLSIRGEGTFGFSSDGEPHVHRYTDSNTVSTYQPHQRRKAVRAFMRVVGSSQTVDLAALPEEERKQLHANVSHAQAMILFSTPVNRKRVAAAAETSRDVRDTLALFSGNADE